MRKAFTLIELMISILILSILMIFLYKSYSGLNKSNDIFKSETEKLLKFEQIKKTIYLDMSLASLVTIVQKETNEDTLFLQTSHSIHRRINPYVSYIFKDKKLYRLESLKELKNPISADSEFVVDDLGEIKIFRVYPSNYLSEHRYLIHIVFQTGDEILLKVKALNVL